MATTSIPAARSTAPIAAPAPKQATVTPIDQALVSQISQISTSSSSSASSSSDSVQLSLHGLNLASQLFSADGSLNKAAASSVLQSSINDTLFASLSSPDAAQFSSIAMMLSGAGSTAASTGGDVSQLFQLAAQSKMVGGMPSNLTPTQFSQFLPALAAQIPGFGALLSSASPTPTKSYANVDSSVAEISAQ
ncbi:MAG: hypothetical protein ABJD07_02255 [Gemmatimonadaceae bacterium]